MSTWDEFPPPKQYREHAGPITLDVLAAKIDRLCNEVVTLQKRVCELRATIPDIESWRNQYWDTSERPREPPRHFTWVNDIYKPKDGDKPGRGLDKNLWQAIEQADSAFRHINQAVAMYKRVLEDAELSSEWRDKKEAERMKRDYPEAPGSRR